MLPDLQEFHQLLARIGLNQGSRTLARLFVSETGLTYGGWRKRLLLHETLNRLDRGETVTGIALDLGYQSLSAFIEMFRKELGVSPRRYARQR